MSRQRGTVINFLSRKGFGFIKGETGEKIFVHFSDIKGKDFRTLTDGEEVQYDLIKDPKGLQAKNVVRLNPPEEEEELPPLSGTERTW